MRTILQFVLFLLLTGVAQAAPTTFPKTMSAYPIDGSRCSAPAQYVITSDSPGALSPENPDLVETAINALKDRFAVCPDTTEIQFLGTVGHKLCYIGKASSKDGWRLDTEFQEDTTSVVFPRKANDTLSWTTRLIGTWRGRFWNDDIEIALWIPYASGHPEPTLDAIALAPGRMCRRYGSGNMSHNYGIDLPDDTTQYENIQLRYWLHLDDLQKYGVPGYTERDSIYCSQLLESFVVFADMDTGRIFAMKRGGYTLKPSDVFWPLERVDASAAMRKILADNTQKQRIKGLTKAQQLLIYDKNETVQGHAAEISLSCMVPYQFALTQARINGIDQIEAFPKNDGTVEISYVPMSGGTKSAILIDPGDIDWKNLSMGQTFDIVAPNACAKADATLAYLDRLKRGTLQSANVKVYPKPRDLTGYYLVSRCGVDQLTQFKGEVLGRAERAFGSVTAFKPGETTRMFRWDSVSQRLIIQNYIKAIKKNKTFADSFNGFDRCQFLQADALSKQYGQPVYVSSKRAYPKAICRSWRGRVHVDTCTGTVAQGTEAPSLYLTKDRGTAEAIFKSLSPDEATWIGLRDEGDMCPGGPFCELPGGEYLNAIYRYDLDKVRELDERALAGYRSTMDTLTFGEEKFQKFLSALGNHHDKSLLPYALNEYMFDYKNRQDKCLGAGTFKKELRQRTPDSVFKEVGMDGSETELLRSQGVLRTAVYIVKDKFQGVCSSLCTAEGDNQNFVFWDALSKNKDGYISQLHAGILAIKNHYDCSDPQLEKFEDNFIRMYNYNQGIQWSEDFQRNEY